VRFATAKSLASHFDFAQLHSSLLPAFKMTAFADLP
jgi:hypothetical protein